MFYFIKQLMIPVTMMTLAVIMAPAWSDDDDHEHARELVRQGDIQPLEVILKQLPDSYTRILEVELEHEHGQLVYEIEAVNAQGHVREYLFDARTGKYLGMEQ